MKRWLLVAAVLLGACSDPAPRGSVVVYVADDLAEYANERFAESGFVVTIVTGTSAELADKVINKQDSPRADVLITSSTYDIWRAGDQGALRPMQQSVLERAETESRDPDNAWIALGWVSATIGVAPDAELPPIQAYRDLGSPQLAGQLCLTSSALPLNRALIAMLIADLGVKPAERVVRSWSRNLALPPFASETALLEAVAAGTCKVAIVSDAADGPGLDRIYPEPTYRDIRGVGVSRHAQNAQAAHAFVDWMLSDLTPQKTERSNGRNIGIAGWRDEEARLLAERAGYR